MRMEDEGPDVAWKMAAILGTMVAVLGGILQLQQQPMAATTATATAETTAAPSTTSTTAKKPSTLVRSSPLPRPRWLPDPSTEPSKHAYEKFVAIYTPIWMMAFGVVVAFRLYEGFTAWTYVVFTAALALPLLLQPIMLPSAAAANSPDARRPLLDRYAFKANVWLAAYSFIGNYWYTHYFYSVLKARYTMPAHRLNNVPIAMFLATHFYFSSYHLFSNLLLRQVVTRYRPSPARALLFVSTVVVFSYFTAFMETLTISSYPYYSFQDRNLAYTVGSAFYGIYFLVSFPAFYFFDIHVDDGNQGAAGGAPTRALSAWDAFVQACGYGMIILFLLDVVRLYLDIPLVVGRDP